MERIVLIVIFVFFTSPVVAGNSIKLVYNMQHPGGDYTSFQASNAAECARKCEQSNRCRAFDFHKSDSSCWLKDRVYQSRPYQGVVSGSKKSQLQQPTRSTSSHMKLSFDTSRPGGDYARFHTKNHQACAEDCLRDPNCVAFDFTQIDSMCYMKNWEPPASPYQGVISGIKKKKNTVPQRASGQIRSVQKLLAEQGYNPGLVDGMMGRNTRIALKNYQRDYNLPVTGRIDESTLASIKSHEHSTTPPAQTSPAVSAPNPEPTPAPDSAPKRVELSPKQFATMSLGNEVSFAIFPWILKDESDSLISILKQSINYHIGESETFRLKKSYYKIKGISQLGVADSWSFYNYDKPNITLVQQTARKHGIDFALLGTMSVHCRWADECQVRQMEIMLVDARTGVITAVNGGSWEEDARDYIDSQVSEVLKKLENKLYNY